MATCEQAACDDAPHHYNRVIIMRVVRQWNRPSNRVVVALSFEIFKSAEFCVELFDLTSKLALL